MGSFAAARGIDIVRMRRDVLRAGDIGLVNVARGGAAREGKDERAENDLYTLVPWLD
jgi:hypothetical protein